MTISLALIVKNEEETLATCLDSLASAVDEIVIIDTGSQDATRQVARRYTPNVYDFTWVRDFSAARQFAFDRARGDWVAWVDADDVVYGAEHIRQQAAQALSDIGAIYWPYIYGWDEYGNPTCQFWRERLVRNDGSYFWQGRAHEVLTTFQPWKNLFSEQVIVEHHPPAARHDRGRRNLEILEEEYRACQQNPPARLLFYLGREYAACGQPQKALQIFSEHLQHCTWGDERYQALLQVAGLQLEQKEGEKAIDTLLQALKVCPHWPDAYFALARIYYFQRDWHKVVHWTEVGRAMPQPQTIYFINPMSYRYDWIIYFTNALFHIGEVAEALAWTRRALEICPGDIWHRENLTRFTGLRQETLPPVTPLAELTEEAHG